ncbi:hypothetical protein ILUMI_19064 [Ignelater luminosus]|uniref:Uncharacterized protein n=1 Tax=Ignelater luminosus TaxID=2038154 RepID=A0A8K0CGV0_IGNLU|nr:hypothetical protein ILUMI_19064 [Ignelater luminosus]
MWPKIPERKGKRQSERLPYVITWSGWKKIVEEKERGKLEKVKKAKENKRKRAIKIEAKITTKKHKTTKIRKDSHVRNLILEEEYITQISLQDVAGFNVGNNKTERELKECDEENETERILKEYENHIAVYGNRGLPRNIIKNKGLWFICIANVSVLRFRIQCQKCAR